jgi:hypothetical protein
MFLRTWRARHVVTSWIVYWILLLLVVAWTPLTEYVRIMTTTKKGEVSVHFSGSPTALALWIAGPPLLIWLAWLVSRPRRIDRVPTH